MQKPFPIKKIDIMELFKDHFVQNIYYQQFKNMKYNYGTADRTIRKTEHCTLIHTDP